jgi:TIR domain
MIFLSYSRRDKVQCDEIARALQEKGFNVWRDTKDIRGGNRWRAEIEKGIKDSDIFVILLSPNLSEYAQEELEFAHKNQKKIIGVWLKQRVELPEGYEIVLGGRQQITEIANDFAAGLEKLFEALGRPDSDQPAGPKSLWQKALRKAQRYRALAANSDLGPKALKAGAYALAGAVAVAVAVAKASEKQQTEALRQYRDSVDKILKQYIRELGRSADMSPDDYLKEFRPRVRELLGILQGKEVPVERLKQSHLNFVAKLKQTIQAYDDVFMRLADGDNYSCRREIQRFVEHLAEMLEDHTKLLDGVMSQQV